jgi:hypothetical protein
MPAAIFVFEARWIHRRPTSVVEIHSTDYAIFAPVPAGAQPFNLRGIVA